MKRRNDYKKSKAKLEPPGLSETQAGFPTDIDDINDVVKKPRPLPQKCTVPGPRLRGAKGVAQAALGQQSKTAENQHTHEQWQCCNQLL